MNSRLTTSVVAVMHRMTRCPGRGEKFWWMGEKWERRAGRHGEFAPKLSLGLLHRRFRPPTATHSLWT